MNGAYLQRIERAADREAAAIDLAPRVIGAAVDAASYRALVQASREMDLPVAEIIRQSLSAVLMVEITAPQIRTGAE